MKTFIRILSVCICLFIPIHALAVTEVGKVVALRGSATIERKGAQQPVKVNSSLEATDAVATAAASRAKLLFIDDSVLSLGEKTRISIREFIQEKGKTGSSIFNMLDGKMRAVVGKTKFEVHTPTAVAAARGTVIYFEVGKNDDSDYTKILCLEGKVDVRSINASISGTALLTPGMMVIVTANKPIPAPVPAPPLEMNGARQNTASNIVSPLSVGTAEITPITSPATTGKTLVIDLPAEEESDPELSADAPVDQPTERVAASLPSSLPAEPGLPTAQTEAVTTNLPLTPPPFVPPVALPPQPTTAPQVNLPQPTKVIIRIR